MEYLWHTIDQWIDKGGINHEHIIYIRLFYSELPQFTRLASNRCHALWNVVLTL